MVPLTIFLDSPLLVEGKILYKPCDFVDPFFFARVLVEVQFLGYKFGLKGSTYTRENMVSTSYSGPKISSLLHVCTGCFKLTKTMRCTCTCNI